MSGPTIPPEAVLQAGDRHRAPFVLIGGHAAQLHGAAGGSSLAAIAAVLGVSKSTAARPGHGRRPFIRQDAAVPPTTSRKIQDPALRRARMASLLLGAAGSGGRDIGQTVEWFGAMQAQDARSVDWSVGVRTGASRLEMAAALESGTILRTWPMRGTLHLVPAADARWMLRHLAVRSQRQAAKRRTDLGLDERQVEGALEVLRDALAGGRVLTRAQCVAALSAAGIPTDGQRAYHLLLHASIRGIICVGPTRDKQQTFVLLQEWAPHQVELDRPQALARIAERFVRSHGPATVHDLARWADLTLTDARAGFAAAPGLLGREYDGVEMMVAEQVLDAQVSAPPARALPGFDEFVLGYRDRTAQLTAAHEQMVVPGGNGVFSPTLVLDGRAVGTWRARELASTVRIAVSPFERIARADRSALTVALEAYAAHVGLPAQVSWED